MNHEYTDDGLLHPDGMARWSAREGAEGAGRARRVGDRGRRRGEAAGRWCGRRRTRGASPPPRRFAVGGPAAGHALDADRGRSDRPASARHVQQLRQRHDAVGHLPVRARRTSTSTSAPAPQPTAHEHAAGGCATTAGYRWQEHDARFDATPASERAEPLRLDRRDRSVRSRAAPVKRTALGRSRTRARRRPSTRDGRVVVYSGDDARFEYIYKFVSRERSRPGGACRQRATCSTTARSTSPGSTPTAPASWLPLSHGSGPLPGNGFADQADVLIKARRRATRSARPRWTGPEWMAVDPATRRGLLHPHQQHRRGSRARRLDTANPRAVNALGHIIRWSEDGDDRRRPPSSGTIFVLAGDRRTQRAEAKRQRQGRRLRLSRRHRLRRRAARSGCRPTSARPMHEPRRDGAHRQQPDAAPATPPPARCAAS